MASCARLAFGYLGEKKGFGIYPPSQMEADQKRRLFCSMTQGAISESVQRMVKEIGSPFFFEGSIARMTEENICVLSKATLNYAQLKKDAEEIEPNVLLAVNLEATEKDIEELVDHKKKEMELALEKAKTVYEEAKKSTGLKIRFFIASQAPK